MPRPRKTQAATPPKRLKSSAKVQVEETVGVEEVVEEEISIDEPTIVEVVAEETKALTPKLWCVRIFDKVKPELRIGTLQYNERTEEFTSRFDNTNYGGQLQNFMTIRDTKNTVKWLNNLPQIAKDALPENVVEAIIIGEAFVLDEA